MIRRAVEADIPAIAHMLRLLHAESPHYVHVPVDEDYVLDNLREMVCSTSIIFLFWEGKGFIIGQHGQQWYEPRPRLIEHLIYCLPEWRGVGGFVRLIKAFELEGTAIGAELVNVGITTGINMDAMVRVYERLGYVRTGITLEKHLGG